MTTLGIIGAGATTVQMVPVMAPEAASVTVFQRTPNFILPAMQQPMTEEWEREIKSRFPHSLCRGAATVCRIALGLCPPVPGSARKGGCLID